MLLNEKILTRLNNGYVSGTLKGLADYYGLRLGRLRLFFVLMMFCGVGIFIYFVLWLCIPSYSQRSYLLEKRRQQLQQEQE